MKSMIKEVLEGAIDRRSLALGVNTDTPRSGADPYFPEGDKGSGKQKLPNPALRMMRQHKAVQSCY